jgi:hypothetical protein
MGRVANLTEAMSRVVSQEISGVGITDPVVG